MRAGAGNRACTRYRKIYTHTICIHTKNIFIHIATSARSLDLLISGAGGSGLILSVNLIAYLISVHTPSQCRLISCSTLSGSGSRKYQYTCCCCRLSVSCLLSRISRSTPSRCCVIRSCHASCVLFFSFASSAWTLRSHAFCCQYFICFTLL